MLRKKCHLKLFLDSHRVVEELGAWAKTLLETQLLICVWQGTESPLWAWPLYQALAVGVLARGPGARQRERGRSPELRRSSSGRQAADSC